MKELILKVTKATLVITEGELMQCLSAKPEVFEKAIGRGKGLIRAQTNAKRQKSLMNRWQLYEALKGNWIVDDVPKAIETMPIEELREGCIEYLMALPRRRSIINEY